MCAMVVESEHTKESKKLNSELFMDRISSLPDELLINILNFLPTNCAFVTSTLFAESKHLFKEVNTIDFDDLLAFNDLIPFEHGTSWVPFETGVCRMMDCIELSNLTRFRISCASVRSQCFVSKVESWLSAVLSHGIQEIDLCFNESVKFQNTIFNCETLRVLKLTANATIHLPDTVYLPRLKILHLKNVMVLGMTSDSKLLLACPLLQDFCMESYYLTEVGHLSIFKQSLTRLRLENSVRFNNDKVCSLVTVVAPWLQYFHYAGPLAKSYSIFTSSNLVEACIDIPRDFNDLEDVSAISHSISGLIQAVSTAKCVFLSANCIEALDYVTDELPILSSLIKLKLGCSTILNVTLTRLLESAPYLEELIFTKGLFPVETKETGIIRQDCWGIPQDCWGRRDDVPSCLKTHLKVIKIDHFLGFPQERRVLEYFLSNSHSQVKVTIHNWVGTKRRFNILKRMAMRWNKFLEFTDQPL